MLGALAIDYIDYVTIGKEEGRDITHVSFKMADGNSGRIDAIGNFAGYGIILAVLIISCMCR